MRTAFIAIFATITLSTASVPSAHAQTYPAKGLRIIVPFAAGGSTDIFAVAESGVPGYESLSWSGFAVASGTPREIVAHEREKWSRVIRAAAIVVI